MLYFTVAIPRTGKTTFANKWKKEGENRVLVSGDEIRLAVYGKRFSLRGEPTVSMVKSYMIRTLLQEGYDVLYDDTNTTWKSIEMIFEIDKNARYIIFPSDPQVSKERAILTHQEDLIIPIDRMYSNYLSTVERLRKEFPYLEEKIQ